MEEGEGEEERVRERESRGGGGDREIGMGEKLRGGVFSLSHRGVKGILRKKMMIRFFSNIYSLINFQCSITIYREVLVADVLASHLPL